MDFCAQGWLHNVRLAPEAILGKTSSIPLESTSSPALTSRVLDSYRESVFSSLAALFSTSSRALTAR
jgi:hypothetical protein